MMRIWLAIAALAACGKHGNGGGTTGSSAPPPVGSDVKPVGSDVKPGSDTVAEKPATPAGPATAPWKLDPAVVLGKLEGSWVVRGFGSSDSVTAWKLEHGELTIFDPKTKEEKKDKLELWSPCEAHLASSGYNGTFVVDGDDIYLGLGGGGMKRGDTVIACMGSGTVVATPKGCATYYLHFGSVDVIPTRCSYPDGRFATVEGGTDHRRSSLRFWGNDHLLLSDQLAESKLDKQPSWEAAKAAAAKPKPSQGPSPASTSSAPTNDGVTLVADPAFPPPPPEDTRIVPWSDDNSAALAKLQGAWVVKGFGQYGAVSAWKIDGAKVTAYNPKTHLEMPDVLLFESPCAVRLDSGDGGTLVIDGDTVYLGLGNGGMKIGDTTYACLSMGTVVATPTGCATYHDEFDTWTKLDTTCKQDAHELSAKAKDDESSVNVANDHTLLSTQLAASKLVKQKDWAAAKAAADRAAK